MVKICFYNMNHIGDIYYSSLFINLIAEQNKDMNFYYFCICGDSFFYKNKNLIKINKYENNYNKKITNGEGPEKILNSDILNILLNNKMELKQLTTFNINNQTFLFINTWNMAPIIKFEDCNIISSIKGWENLINTLNLTNLTNKINFKIKDKSDISIPFINNTNDHNLINIDKTLSETIFIFNYKPRSLTMPGMDQLINNLAINNKVLLANYEEKYANNNNITFFENEYNIIPTPDCINLIKIWDIIIHCKKIIIIPSGSSFTFLHKLKEIKKNQIFMYYSHHYCNILNNNINYLMNETLNLINII